ncbi:potassium channel family protein [Methanohalophilus mahii]|uniref:TrkA-N domain protein n=1 Tax=Methanohalophilus mahii (strain ATCC 35705 / DSM 5219 / SLP) TaxID=547558 RepID=D5E6N5_METMS|nr:NAD-binding protein [Methanohalophilus mahii]ADE36823.1 TrkA-N domain protein [Methanohalophilus mahii DSM 5219]
MQRGHIVVLGYGDVGKRVAEILDETKIPFVIVDSKEELFFKKDFEYIIGNGTDEEILKSAGIEDASTIIICLNDDTDVIFATLVSRGLNPDSTIFARANSVESIDKIYKAGGDYVASLSIVAGQMLAKITSLCYYSEEYCPIDEIMLYEGIEIERYVVDKRMEGRTVGSLGLYETTGCRIIGYMKNEQVHIDELDDIVLERNDVISVVGTRENIARFKAKYKDVKDK